MQPIIICDQLFFRYQEEQEWILHNFSLQVNKGDWIAVLGTNGSGKSTFARMLNGLLQPESGTVTVAGYEVADEEKIWNVRQKAGMVFQNPDHQFVAATVQDDIAFGLENAGIERREMLQRIDEVSKRVGIEDLLTAEPHRLSGGQKQRAAIAGIIALRPDIMIFDEVTSMLDPKGRAEVMETMKDLNRAGISMIMITHDLEEALMADRVIFMEKGKTIRDRTVHDFFQDPDFLKTRNFTLPYFLEMQVALKKHGVLLGNLSLSESEWVDRLCALPSEM
ncbi:energy-coupling factor transport system ATP-binding protein [Geomicrobium halophilum]|uniref:Energy-coupling factor transport system ATP-binding protein n=1 Tax=Geomicrobium halophilum TaxID=549000 RepID=A0A841PRR5_9BACL|nr:energy-coupling factor transporter ATPase [Geomicrobium halophilum]MBB6451490.1 energy-coupling factor transport system ATP-binding protein [Geomicrobium halophilum]